MYNACCMQTRKKRKRNVNGKEKMSEISLITVEFLLDCNILQ